MSEKFPHNNSKPTEIMDTDHSTGNSVNPNADSSVQFQQLQNRLDKMSDQVQVMTQKVSRLRRAIGNLQDSDEKFSRNELDSSSLPVRDSE